MRFSTFHQPLAPTSADDARVIDEQIEQVVAAEELGYHTAWLTEHLFNATCAYGDPTLIAAALSQRTTRIRVGFAVLQMAMTHPARLVIQAGLLDNLLKGRLTLGLGRGSAFNPHEYEAFGVTPDAERDRAQMFEAIELMERAWAGDGSFEGEHYRVAIPEVRPAPVQRPHAVHVHAEVLALERRVVARPRLRHQLDRLEQALALALRVGAEAGVLELVEGGAAPQPNGQPPAEQVVQCRGLDQQPRRMVQRHLQHREADADTRGPLRQRRPRRSAGRRRRTRP